jgi:hypothetical protein
VFKDWKIPKDRTWKQMLIYDIKHWKIKKIEKKKESEAILIGDMFKEKVVQLHNLYIETAARSNFPSIKWFDWSEFCEQFNKNPECTVDKGKIDRIFGACMSDIRGDGMYRYHFYEGLVRFAKAKYLETGVVESSSGAFRKFLDEDLFCEERAEHFNSWMNFREDILWQ